MPKNWTRPVAKKQPSKAKKAKPERSVQGEKKSLKRHKVEVSESEVSVESEEDVSVPRRKLPRKRRQIVRTGSSELIDDSDGESSEIGGTQRNLTFVE